MTQNLSDTPLQSPSTNLPRLGLFTMFRLGLFQMGLGMMSLLTLGVLNRVMIAELAIPAVVAASTIAAHQFMAPARVWFGQLSDAKKFLGYHRTGYVWAGALLFVLAAFLALQVSWQLGSSLQANGWTLPTYIWTGLLAVIFALYGLALSSSSTPFAALLVDVSDEDDRPKLVGIVWSMLMVGIVIGAIVFSVLTKRLDADASLSDVQTIVNQVFLIIPGIVFGLAILATVGIEDHFSRYRHRSGIADREDSITLGKALRVLTASRQTGLFFTFLLVMTISLFMQEPVLEPYGAKVFDMSLGETTRLNAYWGMGTLMGISSTGFFIVPRLGKQNSARLGCLLVAASMLLIIFAGTTQNARLFQGLVFVFGLASGITTTGSISLMLDLTAAETAGTFIGAWGLSQAIARGLATVIGGGVLSLGEQIFQQQTLLAYSTVFGLQAIGMVLAVWFLNRVNVQEFQDNARSAIAAVLESDLD
ncbi:MAG: BCD family MFS transporter [Cyanobacteria bacterium]|nr:BCD family MFS transporter [Cyanobacteriota bacterium]MDW8201901.1 BCD family MFS transporter [Cyanobacteriota bacterium SKYGB_h_bin112]